MTTRTMLYRSTLIAAAVAVGCLGAAAAAGAHEHGDRDRDRDGDRRGAYAPHAWHERAEHRGGGYYRPVPVFRPAFRGPQRDDRRAYVVPEGYFPSAYDAPPVVVYRPAPRAEVVYGDSNVSLMIHLPL